MLKIKSNGDTSIEYSVDVNLNDEWAKVSNTPVAMGCIVTTQSFIDNNKAAIDSFLLEYKASVDFIGNMENIDTAKTYIVDAGIMGAAPAAQSALKNLSGAIVYKDNTKEILDAFYGAIGETKPDDNFYYKK
jgi:NitT/TauT family transport system substrate-binding protein